VPTPDGADEPSEETGPARPAYYAARPGGWRDWWTLLHPPYTAWHLSYAVIGAALAPRVYTSRLIATVLAFFLAVGLAAHALDELRGRPLRTRIPSPVLIAVVIAGLAGALALAVAPVLAAVGAFALSAAQRQLSTPARNIRRRAIQVAGSITFADGRIVPITADSLLTPLERALRATSWAIVLLAAAMAVARLS